MDAVQLRRLPCHLSGHRGGHAVRCGADVLETFERRFYSGSSSGLGGGRFMRRRPMIEQLTRHSSAVVRDWARTLLPQFDELIAQRALLDRVGAEAFE